MLKSYDLNDGLLDENHLEQGRHLCFYFVTKSRNYSKFHLPAYESCDYKRLERTYVQ